ncbi:MAG: 6-phosphogluconolactonase [Arenimonas sp.]
MIDSPGAWHEFANREKFNEALVQRLAGTLQSASLSQGHVLLGLSGGTTPMPVYQALSQKELAWNRIKLVLVDERWVANNHADSNERNIREAFAGNALAEKNIIGLWSEKADLESAAIAADQKLAAINEVMDVVLLGMGEDGHFASLFPSGTEFDHAISTTGSRFVFPISPMPDHATHPRLSMSLAYIQRAKRIILAITGEKKRLILKQAITEGNSHRLPIAALFTANSPAVEVYWSK